MNFLSLEYFQAIVEEKSFSQAAKRLHVSQQSLSEHVKKLETNLGAVLLNRGKELSLTIAGECLYDGAVDIFAVKNKMFKTIADIASNRNRKISIGITTYGAPPFLPGLLIKFATDFPEYQYTVIKRREVDLAHNMSGIDLFIAYQPIDQNLEQILLVDNQECAIVIDKKLITKIYGKELPFTENSLLKQKELFLLKDLPFILPEDNYGQRKQYIDTFFEYAGFNPKVCFQSDNGELNAAMCIRGSGAFVGPFDYCKRQFSSEISGTDSSLSVYRVVVPAIDNSLVICYEKEKILNSGEKYFIEAAKSYLSEC